MFISGNKVFRYSIYSKSGCNCAEWVEFKAFFKVAKFSDNAVVIRFTKTVKQTYYC